MARRRLIVSMSDYRDLPEEEVFERIESARVELGKDLVILGHHYQRDEVVRFADHRGDSLELSRAAAAARDAKYVVFCGVDFMAESAAILCDPAQAVLLPAKTARCPMARMADVADALNAWEHLTSMWGDDLVPVTYQNSSAELKAFCGERGGAVCTSSNARAVFRWALAQKGHILFFPDEHLGRNTALSLGFSPREIGVWDPQQPFAVPTGLAECKVVVWKGYCHVHTFFTVQQVELARERYPDASVIVHPECPAEVVARSDKNGSTSFIVRTVEESPAGTTLVIGTEINLVSRLAKEHPDKTVVPLARSLCGAMFHINPHNLLYTLEGILEDRVDNVVQVPREIAQGANLALEKMLAVT
jgi:quinolinate synthase